MLIMKTDNKYRILLWIIVILIATNLSTVGSFYYHRMTEEHTTTITEADQTSIPGEQRTRYFRDELNLDDNQIDQFREINRSFNHSAKTIEEELTQLRQDFIHELGAPNTDSLKLNNLATEVGAKHRKLKLETSEFYLNMKHICTLEQKEKLNQIFQSMLNSENQINLPQQGNGRGRWRNK